MTKYINADALISDIKQMRDTPNGYSDTFDKSEIIGVIEEQPAADVRPNVRGEWVDFPTKNVSRNAILYRCSICGMQKFFETEQTMNVYITTMSEYKFCPNCGADMRKKGEE